MTITRIPCGYIFTTEESRLAHDASNRAYLALRSLARQIADVGKIALRRKRVDASYNRTIDAYLGGR